MQGKKKISPYLYLIPAFLILFIFKFYPIFKTFAMAFYTKFDYLTDTVFETGTDNFEFVLKDEEFYLAVRNSIIYAIISVPLGITVGLFFAILLNSIKRFAKFFRSIYFLPFVTSSAAVSIIWRWMLNKDYGIVNDILEFFHVSRVDWMGNPAKTLPILILLSIWKGLGYKIIVLLASLQNVDENLIKQSKIDGANSFERIRYVILPTLKPSIIFLAITGLIGSLKLFDEVYIMYQQKPGPLQSGLTMVYYVFTKFYRYWEFGNASAAAVLLFFIIVIVTLLQVIFIRLRRDE